MNYKTYSTAQLIKMYDQFSHQPTEPGEPRSVCLELMCRAFAHNPRDAAAFEWMHDHYGKRILHQVLARPAGRMLGSIVDGTQDDILQQTYFKMFKHWSSIEAFDTYFGERLCDGVEGYLRIVMYATVCDELRTLSPTAKPPKRDKDDPSESPPPKTHIKTVPIDEDETAIIVDETVIPAHIQNSAIYIRSILTDEEWALIFGHDGLDIPLKELVNYLSHGMTPGNAAQKLYKLRQRLHCDPMLCDLFEIDIPDDCE